MKRVVVLILVVSILFGNNFVIANAEEGVSIEVPTGEEWESIPERNEWPDSDTIMPRWKYTARVSLYLSFTGDHANILLDVDGYNDATRVEAVLVYEESVNGTFIERKRETAYENDGYLFYNMYPSAIYGHTYRVTGLVRVFSGSDYDYITVRNTKTYNSANTVSVKGIQR